jgi:hypothetical protein
MAETEASGRFGGTLADLERQTRIPAGDCVEEVPAEPPHSPRPDPDLPAAIRQALDYPG